MSRVIKNPPRFFGAQHCGEGHAARGEPCCDALFLAPSKFHPSGFVICDGAGGTNAVACGAAFGARAAWQALLLLRRELRRYPRQEDQSLRSIQSRFKAAFFQRSMQVHNISHTVLACLWDRKLLLVVQIGDSTLLIKRGKYWEVPLQPAKGEFANQTVFLKPDTIDDSIQVWWTPSHQVEAVIGFSDGLEPAFLAPKPGSPSHLIPNSPLADLVIQEHRQRAGWRDYPAWLAASLADKILHELSDDDKTLVIACR
jgi:hypothetical protein